MPDAASKLIYPIYKGHLAPLRLLHFLALAILVSRLTPPDWNGLMKPWMIAMVRCGENSAAIYSSVVWLTPFSSVDWMASPMQLSSSVAATPPCTVPAGLR